MSIVTLKRKTQAKYNNVSVGKNVFSINGVFRNQGYVGQTSLGRSIPKILEQSNNVCCSTEDSSTVKQSVLSNSGMLRTKYRWITRPSPYATVKSDVNNNTSDQSTYITKKIKKTLSEIKKANDPNDTSCTNVNTVTPSPCVSDVIKHKKVCDYTRDASEYLPISYGEYIIQLGDACQESDVVLTRPTCGETLPGDRKSTRLNSSHPSRSRMPSSA